MRKTTISRLHGRIDAMTKALQQNRRFYLRQRRRLAGFTQERLAEAVGTTKGVISQLETGHQRYNEDWIEKIANALDIQAHELFLDPENDAMQSADEKLRGIAAAWVNLTEAQRAAIASVASEFSHGKPA